MKDQVIAFIVFAIFVFAGWFFFRGLIKEGKIETNNYWLFLLRRPK